MNSASWNHSRHVLGFCWEPWREQTLLHAGIRFDTGGGDAGSGGVDGVGGGLGDAGGPRGSGGVAGCGSGEGGGTGGGGGESALQHPLQSHPSFVRLLHVISTPSCLAFCQKRHVRPLQSLPHAGSAGGETGGGETAGGGIGGAYTRAGQQPSHSHPSEFCKTKHVTPRERKSPHGLVLQVAEQDAGSGGIIGG